MAQFSRKLLSLLSAVTILLVAHGFPAIEEDEFLEPYSSVFSDFKENLVQQHGISQPFADQLVLNLRKAILQEIRQRSEAEELPQSQTAPSDQAVPVPRQDEDEDDDDESTTPGTTTLGPSPFNVVQGIYGILNGIGSLNPDKVFTSTVNFFPPSQKGQAQALIDSALGMKPSSWPTTTTTPPTTTNFTTSTRDPDDDDDDDATTKAAIPVTVATPAPAPPQTIIVLAPPLPVAATAAPTAAPVQAVITSTKGEEDEDDEAK